MSTLRYVRVPDGVVHAAEKQYVRTRLHLSRTVPPNNPATSLIVTAGPTVYTFDLVAATTTHLPTVSSNPSAFATVYSVQHVIARNAALAPLIYKIDHVIAREIGTLRQWSVDMSWSVADDMAIWELDSEWLLIETHLQERELTNQWSTGSSLKEFAIDFTWAITGSQVLIDLRDSINTLREGLGLSPVSLYTGPSVDIAQRHSRHMRDYGIYAHEDPAFPAGWRLFTERMAKLAELPVEGNECLLLGYSSGTLPGSFWYGNWRDSPPHYANMTFDFGPGSNVKMMFGVEHYGSIPAYPTPPGTTMQLGTLVLFDLDIGSGLDMEQRTLRMEWASYGALIERLDMLWETRAFVKVRTRHTASYALRVKAEHSAGFGVFVSASHTAQTFYTTRAEHSASYGSTLPVRADLSSGYDVEQYAKVRGSLIAPWALQVRADHYSEYSDSPRAVSVCEFPYESSAMVRITHDAMYDDKPRAVAEHTGYYTDSERTTALHTASYALLPRVLAEHRARYSDYTQVMSVLEAGYDLLQNNPVRASHRSFYTISDGGAILQSIASSVKVAGIEVDPGNIDVRMDEGDAGWSATVEIMQPSDYALINLRDVVEIAIGGEVFTMFVDTKSINRSDPVDIRMEITCLSPVMLLEAPYSEPADFLVDTVTGARSVVEQLLGQTVDWRIIDWPILPYRFAVQQQTPLSSAKLIAEAVGAVIESEPDGSLYVRYLYPVSVPSFESATPDMVLTDIDDNLSSRDKRYRADVFNSFRVREGKGILSDSLEWVPDEEDATSGTLRAYLEPWRYTAEVHHTDTLALPLIPMGVVSREETEVVEIVDGEGTLRYSAVGVDSYEWLSASMGTLIHEPRTKTIAVSDPATNWGYGLVRVVYRVETLNYRTQIPTSEPIQYLIVDKGN